MHKFPETGEFGQKMQHAELDYLVHSTAASTALAENYVGLPLPARSKTSVTAATGTGGPAVNPNDCRASKD